MRRLWPLALLVVAHVATAESFPREILANAQAAAVVIRTPHGGGSGFIVREGEKYFVITNQHVVLGADANEIKMRGVDGEAITPIGAEMEATSVDLIRFPIKERPKAVLPLTTGMAVAGSEVCAIGNSLDTAHSEKWESKHPLTDLADEIGEDRVKARCVVVSPLNAELSHE